MNAVTATRRTIRREWTAFGALLIISVGLMGISDTTTAHDLQSAANTLASPVETVINNIADTAGSYFSALTQIDHLRSENEQLKQDNLTLQEELDRMGAISQLNDDWTKITTEQGAIQYQSTPVRVIVRDTSTVQVKAGPQPLEGVVFVMTGEFGEEREKLGKKLESLGAIMKTGVSKKVNLLLVGTDAGHNKLAKAQELKIRTEGREWIVQALKSGGLEIASGGLPSEEDMLDEL